MLGCQPRSVATGRLKQKPTTPKKLSTLYSAAGQLFAHFLSEQSMKTVTSKQQRKSVRPLGRQLSLFDINDNHALIGDYQDTAQSGVIGQRVDAPSVPADMPAENWRAFTARVSETDCRFIDYRDWAAKSTALQRVVTNRGVA